MPKINITSIETGNEANAELWNSRYAKIVDLVNGKLDSENLAAGAVTSSILAPNSVIASKVPDGELDDSKWVNGAVFYAYRGSARSLAQNTWHKLGCDTITINTGDGYSNTDDETTFTAPVDGTYFFNFGADLEAGSNTRGIIRLNRSWTTQLRPFDTQSTRVRRVSGTATVVMEQGQSVSVEVYFTGATTDIEGPDTFFGGFLVSRGL